MWGNTNIKNNELWGADKIRFTELRVNNKIHCMYDISGTVNVKIYDHSLADIMPNYDNAYGELTLVPEVIKISDYYSELRPETKEYLYFGDQSHDIDIYDGMESAKLVEFWNGTDIDNPYLWRTLASYVCKNYYHVKKQLIPKNISVYVAPQYPMQKDVKYICVIESWGQWYFAKYPYKYHAAKFSFKLLHRFLHKSLRENMSDIKITGIEASGITINMGGIETTFSPTHNSHGYILTVKDNKFVLPPRHCTPITYIPMCGFMKKNFIIRCPQSTIKTDLDILIDRCGYFKSYKNSGLGGSSIDSQWELVGLITFIMDCKCVIVDAHLELHIADYYQCEQYKIYINNWLIVHNLAQYYEIYGF